MICCDVYDMPVCTPPLKLHLVDEGVGLSRRGNLQHLLGYAHDESIHCWTDISIVRHAHVAMDVVSMLLFFFVCFYLLLLLFFFFFFFLINLFIYFIFFFFFW